MIVPLIILILILIATSASGQVQYGTSSTTYSMYGLSSDTKPVSPPNNCFFIETNTGNTYKSSGGSWSIVGMGKDTLAGYYMPIQRAADSITSIKTSIALKLASSGFTKAAMVALGMLAISDTSGMLSNYQTAINGKQAAGTYATPSSSTAFTNKTGNISQWTNDAGYLTVTPAQSFASLTGKPTTLSGYGITDAYPLSGNPSGFLTSLSGAVLTSRTISTTSPLAGGGDLSANRTFSIANSKADNATLGAASFDSSYFNDNGSGLISFALNYGTGTVSASAVTSNAPRGKITYNSPSIIAAGTATFTLTNSYVNSTSTISVGINGNGSNLVSVNCYIKSQTAGSCVVAIQNLSLLSLFNTNMIIDFMVVN